MYVACLYVFTVPVDLLCIVLELLEGNSEFIAAFMTEPSSPEAWRYIEGAALEAQLPHPPKKVSLLPTIICLHGLTLSA